LWTILTEGAVQVRLGHLDRVMNDVAEEDARILAARGADRDVTRCMARCGKDCEQFMNGLFAGDELRLAALNNREYAVFENIKKRRGFACAILRGKARVLLA